jgi:hypothetical protein
MILVFPTMAVHPGIFRLPVGERIGTERPPAAPGGSRKRAFILPCKAASSRIKFECPFIGRSDN